MNKNQKKTNIPHKKTVREESFGVVPARIEAKKIFFLLVRHRRGHWAFPKGHAEGRESPLETARRELAEETSITRCHIVGGVRFKELYRYSFRGERREKTVGYFLGIVEQKRVRIQERELTDYRWVTFPQALRLLTFDEGRAILEDAHSFLAKHKFGG